MAVFNLRGIRDDLARMVKATAASEGKTLVEFTVELYEGAVRRGGWTAAKKGAGDEQIAKPGKRGKGGQAVGQGIESARSRSEIGGEAGAGGNAEAVDMRAVKMKRLDKLVDMVREEHRVRPYPDDPIETDVVGTTGCKVTVSRPMAGRPAHAANCQCFTCKPPKGDK